MKGDHKLSNLRRALHPPPHDPLPDFPQLNQPPILPPRLATHLHHPHSQLKVKVIHRPAQQLRPDRRPPSTAATAVTAARERIDADGGAHARELGAEGRVRADVLGVRRGELLQQRAEHGQLRLEGLRVGRAEGRAVAGVLGRGQAGAVEGREADAFAGHFSSAALLLSWCVCVFRTSGVG